MLGAFASAGVHPVASSLVVIIDDDGISCICNAKVNGTVPDVLELDDAGIGGEDLSLA